MNSAVSTGTSARPESPSGAERPAVADPAFPLLHPRPAAGWLNDPNGIYHRDGRYHVFFQYNPDSARHQAITWGHISSADLLHWREHPVALRPQPGGPDSFGCWSGVMADDDGVPTAVYSGVDDDNGHSQVTLARGSEDMETWQQSGEIAAGMPDDENVIAVRDPFVFHYGGHRYAVQGAGLSDGRGALLLYDAEDLRHWDYLGIWLTSDHPVAKGRAEANIWECPQLAEVDGRWLLIVSLWRRGDEHHHLSGVAHLVGQMEDDGGRPRFVPTGAGPTDAGPDFYAPQVVALDDRTLLWGWSWESRTQEESDAAGWAGLLTFPRELAVEDGNLVVSPARELTGYRRESIATSEVTELAPTSEALIEPRSQVRVDLQLVSQAGTRSVHSTTSGNSLRLFIDGSIVEIYSDGATATTLRAYPRPDENWVLCIHGEASVSAWELGLPAI